MFRIIKRFVLLLVAFSIPIEFLGADIGITTVTPIKVTAVLLVLAMFLRVVFESRPYPRDRMIPWIAALMLSVLTSSLIGYAAGIPVPNLVSLDVTWFSMFLLYIGMNYLIDDLDDVDLFTRWLAYGGVFVAVTAALGMGYQIVSSEGVRQGGYGGNVNQLGANLSIAFPLAAVFLLESQSVARRLSIFAVLAVHLGGMVMTLSRSTYLAVGVMGLWWFIRYARPGTTARLILPGFVLISALLVLAPESFYERIMTVAPAGQASDDSIRLRLQKQFPDAINMFASNPIAGVGILRTVSWSNEFGRKSGNVIHNSYLQLAAEHGLLGLVPFSAISLLAWLQIGQLIRRARSPGASETIRRIGTRAIYLQIALIGVYVNSLTHATLRDKGPWLVFALSSILVTLMRRNRSAEVGKATDLQTNETTSASA